MSSLPSSFFISNTLAVSNTVFFIYMYSCANREKHFNCALTGRCSLFLLITYYLLLDALSISSLHLFFFCFVFIGMGCCCFFSYIMNENAIILLHMHFFSCACKSRISKSYSYKQALVKYLCYCCTCLYVSKPVLKRILPKHF